MGRFNQLRIYGRLFRRVWRRASPDLVRLLLRRPAIMVAVGTYELGLMASSRVDARLKTLASLKTSSLIGCPF